MIYYFDVGGRAYGIGVVKQWLGDGISNVEWMTPMGVGVSQLLRQAGPPSLSLAPLPYFLTNSKLVFLSDHSCACYNTAHPCIKDSLKSKE